MIRRVERAQDTARYRLSAPIVHGLLISLLRGLLQVGIGNLVGSLALLIKCYRDVERKLVNIRHGLDLFLSRIGQNDIGSRMQLLAKPAIDTHGLQMRGT